jgi:hypothetical protein
MISPSIFSIQLIFKSVVICNFLRCDLARLWTEELSGVYLLPDRLLPARKASQSTLDLAI